jgi:4-alpha-glucanotransferase
MINDKRSCGILLPITSLPSLHGIGDLGPEAYRFADFLQKTHQHYWQILPLTPIEEGLGNSPYSSISAFAGNTLLISLEKLSQQGLLETSDIEDVPYALRQNPSRVQYEEVRKFKEPVLRKAYQNFVQIKDINLRRDFEIFCGEHQDWLDDYALFKSLKHYFEEKSWHEWAENIATYDKKALQHYTKTLEYQIEEEKFLQYLFRRQWDELKAHCQQKDVLLFGDMPIYVNYDSVDVWKHPEFFKLDKNKKPLFVAGTPPDYFSETGQLWGNPVYDWTALEKENFRWWVKRIEHNTGLFDIVRLDHFLGFVNYYEISAEASDATGGQWVPAPAEAFFNTLLARYPELPIVAEDLGTLSQAVKDFMAKYNFPGMKVLQFAFGDDMQKNPYLPHNHIENCVVYTATHDNNTTRGWWRTETDQNLRSRFGNYRGYWVDEHNVADAFCQMALHSVAKTVILPMQDVLDLDENARMNVPGVGEGNWSWRLDVGLMNEGIEQKLRYYAESSGRA